MLNEILKKQGVARNVSDDNPVSLVVMYVGSEASATITVSGGDITFKHGDAGSEAVDSTIDSGGDDPGVIDVSDTSANTLGKVVDMINNSANWKAYLKDAIRADSSTGLLARSETTLTPNSTEVPLYSDTSTDLRLTLRIGSRTSVKGTEEKSAAEVVRIVSKNTYSTGTNKIQVYKVNEARHTEELVFEKDGGASGSEQDIDFAKEGVGSLAVGKAGEHLVVRMIGSAECTGYLTAIGLVARGA